MGIIYLGEVHSTYIDLYIKDMHGKYLRKWYIMGDYEVRLLYDYEHVCDLPYDRTI